MQMHFWCLICAGRCESEYALRAGTAIEIAGDSTRTVFEREVLPIMQQATDIWSAEVQTYEAFELYAGLVQSRAFHMLQENWITGSAQEGDLILRLLCSAVYVRSSWFTRLCHEILVHQQRSLMSVTRHLCPLQIR